MHYRVIERLRNVPDDHHSYGYETESDFRAAVCNLHRRWRGQSGECMDQKHGFLQLRIYNEYGNYDDVWFPRFLLVMTATPIAPYKDEEHERLEQQLDEIWGFD